VHKYNGIHEGLVVIDYKGTTIGRLTDLQVVVAGLAEDHAAVSISTSVLPGAASHLLERVWSNALKKKRADLTADSTTIRADWERNSID